MVLSMVLPLLAGRCQRIARASDYDFNASEPPTSPGTEIVGSASTQDTGLRSTRGSVVMRLNGTLDATYAVVVTEDLGCTDITDSADSQP